MADTYLPAFHACVAKGRASSIMCSYNSINGVPACADADLLTGLARCVVFVVDAHGHAFAVVAHKIQTP
jgi:hypothetical protein